MSYLLTFFAFNTTCTRKRTNLCVATTVYGDKERRTGFGLGRIRTRRRDHDCVRPSHPMASARARYSNMNGGRIFDILGIIMRHHPDGEEEEERLYLYI